MVNTKRTRLVASAPIAALLALAPTSCTSKDQENSGATKPTQNAEGAAPHSDAPPNPSTDKPADTGSKPGLAETVRAAMPDVSTTASNLPDRGNALAWGILRNPEQLLGKVTTQILPSQYASYGDLTTLRAMAGMLGEKSKLVQHFNFAEPAGCVLLDDKTSSAPVACFFSYEGGASAVSTEAADGKQADAQGHVAHHVIDGQDLYVDEIGTTVIVTSQEGLFASSKAYLGETLLPYAKTQRDDASLVAFPSALVKRYRDQAEALLGLGAMGAASATASLDTYEEMDAFEYAFALEDDGAHLRMGIAATPGTPYAALMADMGAGPLKAKWVSTLPASTWTTMAYNFHSARIRTSPAMKPIIDFVVKEYADKLGKDATPVSAAIEAFLDEAETLYGPAFSTSMIHEPGTTGAIVVEIEKAASGRDKWKTWSEGFTTEAVLNDDARQYVGWSFKPEGVVADGVSGDRWTLTAGKKLKSEAGFATFAKRFGGAASLTVDRFELDDRVIFVAALSDIEASDAAAVVAAKGTKTLADAPGGKAVLADAGSAVGIMAGDAKRMFQWLGSVAPEGGPYPTVGVNLTDLYVVTTLSANRTRVDMRLSQGLIDQLKTLVP